MNNTLERLSNAFGPPGFEDDVVAVVKEILQGAGISHKVDRMKNVYARLDDGQKPIVQLDAHTDEVAFMVQSIRPDGCLSFITLGGIQPANLGAQRLLIKNTRGEYVKGIIASVPPHFLKGGQDKAIDLSALYIDVGASSEQEAREVYGLDVGCVGIYDTQFEELPGGIYFGRAFDCRIGCAALTESLIRLQSEDLEVSVVGSYSVQEEVGLRGAVVTSNTIRPDLAIVFEGAPADDTINMGMPIQCATGKGPMLRHYDQGMVTHPGFQKFALETAKAEGIPVQQAVRTGGRTNAASIHLSAQGVPTIVISIPVRYIHTGNNFARESDLRQAVELAVAIVKRLSPEVIDAL